MGSVPISLFIGDDSFWIDHDSSRHLLAVQLQVCTSSAWARSMGCPVFCTSSYAIIVEIVKIVCLQH